MTVLQLWLVLGIPVAVAVAGLLIGGSPVRARIALALLVGLADVFVAAPDRGRVSATVLGLAAVLLLAGGRLEGPPPADPRDARRHLTTAAGRDAA